MINTDIKDRFVKWDGIRREYFSFVINLFLTFSIGLIVFLLKEIDSKEFNKSFIFTLSFLLSFLSTIFGTLTSLSRYFDFKYTAKKLNLKHKKLNHQENIKSEYISHINNLKIIIEKLTLTLFKIQIISFIFSIIFISIYFLTKYSFLLF